ncbi:DUF6223 family protein [Streptomyces sp. NPDC057136]|uniref:DUF6223 family protein n=1 Tax=Streptomyces sp. NPDC057136 TaxID=3346029 RepID=UPI0036251824
MSSSRALTSVRPVLAATGAALLGAFVLAAPAAAHASVVAAGDTGTGSGRLGAIVAAVVALTGMLVGGLSLARSTGRIGPGTGRIGPGTGRIGTGSGTGPGTGSARLGAVVAMAVGLLGVILAALHLANSTGGFGTGNGRAGAIVAAVLGLIGMVLGWLALSRSRRTA